MAPIYSPPFRLARSLAAGSLVLNLAIQTWGLVTKPDITTINDAHRSFFTPSSVFIAILFSTQQILQIAWFVYAWRLSPAPHVISDVGGPASEGLAGGEVDVMRAYASILILGNLCLTLWVPLWIHTQLVGSFIVILINAIAQGVFITYLLPKLSAARSFSLTLTRAVASSAFTLALLDTLHTGSVAFFEDAIPGVKTKAITGAFFGIAACASDWFVGAGLVADLVAFAVSQGGTWGKILGGYAGIVAVIVIFGNGFMTVYMAKRSGYEEVQDEEGA